MSRFASDRIGRGPDRPVYSNLDAAPYPPEPSTIASRLGEHLANPVRFAEMISAMYQDGARVFVEVGPGAILSPMVESILNGRPHLVVSCEVASAPGLSGFLVRLARLLVAGIPLRLERLTEGRSHRPLDLDHLPTNGLPEPATSSSWMVNGSRARPLDGPEPQQLGTGPVLPTPERPQETRNTTAGRMPSPAPSQHAHHDKRDTAMTPKAATVPSQTPAHSDRVMDSFQKTMQMFLEVQKSTMLAYLGGRGSSAVATGRAAGSNGHEVGHTSSTNGHDVEGMEVGWAMPAGIPPGRKVFNEPGQTDTETQSGEGPVNRIGNPLRTAHETTPVSAREIPVAETPDRTSITEHLLEIVRDRTGYPIETLGLDLDIEAELGIDSIKRVEILGKLRDGFPSLKNLSDSVDVMDGLARAHTLGAIIDQMATLAKQVGAASRGLEDEPLFTPESPRLIRPSANGQIEPATRIMRRVLEAVEAPLPRERLGLRPGGRIIVTEDGNGVAEELAGLLESRGVAVERIGGSDRPVEWTSPTAIDAVLDDLRSRGPIAGIVHALPMGQASSGDPQGRSWSERVDASVKGLFLLAKGTAADLESAARAGGSCVIAATALGGRFAGAGSSNAEFFPGHGGIAGMVKTLAREWPLVRCRVVDLPMGERVEFLAERLAEEVFVGDCWPEVGYDRDRRIRLATLERPLERAHSLIELSPGDPIVISGGARGITALVATELARTWRPTLLIVGTTPPPDDTEPAETAGLEGEAEIKAVVNARLQREGRPVSPAGIEAAYQAIRRNREVRDNLAILREAGATVEYASVDVRDPRAMAAALEGWRARHGHPVGLIHGAGLIKDKLIREKSLASFDRVLGTKVEGRSTCFAWFARNP